MTDAKIFQAYSRYYDLLYSDKNYYAESEYVVNLLRKYAVPGSDILEFGCGTGKHGRILAARGFRVTGIEQSANMVEKACSSDKFKCIHGDIRTIDLSYQFDAVVSLFHVISYQVLNEDIMAVFSRAAQHLGLGGLFVFDVWYSPAVLSQRPTVRIKRMSDEFVNVTRIAEPVVHSNVNRVDVNFMIIVQDKHTEFIEQFRETHSMRHFSLPEIDLLADANGFERIGAEEFLSGKEPGEDTWGVCVVLRKRSKFND